jgi:hypothetical protein
MPRCVCTARRYHQRFYQSPLLYREDFVTYIYNIIKL